MKKKLICFLLLVASVLFCSCNNGSNTTATPTADTVQTETAPTSTDNQTIENGHQFGAVNLKLTADALTVFFSGQEHAGEKISVLVLTDEKYKDNWQENTDAVIDIGQINLDDKGEGNLILNVNGHEDNFVVFVFGENIEQCIKEVGANIENN